MRVRSARKTLAYSCAAVVLLGACSDHTTESAIEEAAVNTPAPVQSVRKALSCQADVTAKLLTCSRPEAPANELGPNFLIVGGQGQFVQLTSTNEAYDGLNEIFSADVTVQNLIGQWIGSSDGIAIEGVRVFFHSGPTVTSWTGDPAPTVTVANNDGVGTFTGTDQPYFHYGQVIFPNEVSEIKTWQWNVPPNVAQFVFEVYVQGPVFFPAGWIEVTPYPTAIPVGGGTALTATVKDVLGREVGGTINWSSEADTIATVNGAGIVSGVAPGVVDIFASTQGPQADGRATVTVIGPGYDIELRAWNVPSEPAPSILAAFANAKARWESVITNDVVEVPLLYYGGSCGPFLNEVVDDLLIMVSVIPIDGVDGVLGQAGWCIARGGTTNAGMPYLGIMEFDVADLEDLAFEGLLEDVIVHEMGHVLGVGTLWTYGGIWNLLVPGNCDDTTPDPYFTGPLAQAAFDAAGGTTYGGNKVPVENTGGAGTICAHWRESIHDNELMTGWINVGTNPLSAITVQSLADMGYAVDGTAADAYSLPASPLLALRTGSVHLYNDIWTGPRFLVDEQGRVTAAPTPGQ